MAELKTKPTNESVTSFINKVSDEQRRADCFAVVEMMRKATKAEPEMWGSGIVGFGRYKYRYASGREVEWMLMGLSPRKANLTIYLMPGVDSFPELMKQLGKHTTGKGCIYVKKLADVDKSVLRKLMEQSAKKLADQRIK